MSPGTHELPKHSPEKKVYRTPVLVTYGRVEEITAKLGTGTNDGLTASGIL